jgi:rhamnogalacturonan endolyase
MNEHPFAFSRRTMLGLAGAGTAAAVLGAGNTAAYAADSAPDVQLVDDDTTVTLSNGLVEVTLIKSTGGTSVLKLVGSQYGNEDVNFLAGTHGYGYSTFNYSVGTTSYTASISGATYAIVSQSTDRVEISMTTDDPTKLPFVVELHAAVERGISGVYYFLVFRYPDEMPDGLNIGQLRYAFAAGDSAFTYFVVDDERGVQQRPTIAELAASTTLQDTTYALPDGRVYSKYQNISNLEGDNHVFMISNGAVGLSLIQASKEYFVGGPTKQELTCHDYYDGEILLWHPHTGHYGTPALIPAKGWEKIYGPFLVHAGEASDPEPAKAVAAMWTNAKAAAAREIRQWPYRWVTEDLYAVDDRSSVSGRLHISDGSNPARAWVVLSAPGSDWQLQSENYLYFARADRAGHFRIPAVRPGTYTLSAFVDGVIGEYTQENVTVPTRDLGTVVWHPRSHGRTLWQIGRPDRSAEEFHIYGDNFRKYLTWLEYPYEFPQGVDFTVGVDDPAEKWNFFQPCYQTPGTAAQLAWRGTTADLTLTTWKIRFGGGRKKLRGTATLDIALASSVFGSLNIALNGEPIAGVDPLPGVPGDNGSYRLTGRSMYRLLDPIRFPAESILPGENIITLSPVHPPVAPTSDNWMEPMGGVMYDVIRLQVDRS